MITFGVEQAAVRMKMNRSIGKLALGLGLLAATATVVSSQHSFKTAQPVAPNSDEPTMVQPDRVNDFAWLDNLTGVVQFVRSPTNYRFSLGESLGELPAQITGAALEGSKMTVSYRYQSNGETVSGELSGTVNADGLFVGVYQTRSPQGLSEGDITLTFVADGTASGSYGNAAGTTRIFL